MVMSVMGKVEEEVEEGREDGRRRRKKKREEGEVGEEDKQKWRNQMTHY